MTPGEIENLSAASGLPAASATPPVDAWQSRLVLWLAGSFFSSVALGWLAYRLVQEGLAPAVLFPLLYPLGLGAVLGLLQAAMVRRCRLPGTRLAAVSLLGWGLLCVLSQEFFGYLDYRRQFNEVQNGNRMAELIRETTDAFQPASYGEFVVARVRQHPLLWPLDALLTVGAAVAMASFRLRPAARPIPPPNTA